MPSCYGEMVITLAFIFLVNGYYNVSESLYCIYYTNVRYLDIILGISSISFTLVSLIILIKYIKIRVFYKVLPWIGLIYVGVGTDNKPVDPKPVGGLASIGLGCLITIYYCLFFMFQLLKFSVEGSSRQRQVQHLGQKNIELTTSHIQQQQQQQQQSDDQVLNKERPFISQLCAGGVMPWEGVKAVILCILNGIVVVGNWELGTRYNCIYQLIGGMVMLIACIAFFDLFCYQYVEEEELQGGVLPPTPPPPLLQVQVLISASLPAADQA